MNIKTKSINLIKMTICIWFHTILNEMNPAMNKRKKNNNKQTTESMNRKVERNHTVDQTTQTRAATTGAAAAAAAAVEAAPLTKEKNPEPSGSCSSRNRSSGILKAP